MITYNHERFIAQAIEGVLMQEANFSIELVIGEDCSMDGTRAICAQYAQAHSDRVRLLSAERNLGMQANSARTLTACRGKYIALCEGDDYWTDSNKLAKQVTRLEADETLSFCFHNVETYAQEREDRNRIWFTDADIRLSNQYRRPKHRMKLTDLLKGNFLPTGSVLFRRCLWDAIPGWVSLLPAPDWGLLCCLLKYGDAAYLDEVMGVYRLHSGSTWSSMDTLDGAAAMIRQVRIMQRELGEPHSVTLDVPLQESLDCFARSAAGRLRGVLSERGMKECLREAKHMALRSPESGFSAKQLIFMACETMLWNAAREGHIWETFRCFAICVMARPSYLFNRHAMIQLFRAWGGR